MKTTCFVQAHHTNIKPGNTDHKSYCIHALKESGFFDHIVIAGADLPENKILSDVAKSLDIECILGSVDNIVDRMLEVCNKTSAEILVRVLIDWFCIDINLIGNMIEKLKSNQLDYVNLPYDFDLKFGADVHSTHGLQEVRELFLKNPELSAKYKFRPWFLIEENPYNNWRVKTIYDVPVYSNERFYELQKEFSEQCPIAWDFGSTFYYHEYVYAANHVSDTDVVLDVACGWGAGTLLLANKCVRAVGVDIIPEYIKTAKKRCSVNNCEYEIGDGTNMDFLDNTFDVVISVHSMEHIQNDHKFLKEVSRVLKPNGKLIIEVPLRMRRPFIFNEEPFMPDHVREYDIETLQEMINRYFDIEVSYGANRGNYCNVSKARNAAMFVGRKKK